MFTRRMLLKIAAVALLHPALRWTAPAVATAPHGYREVRPGVFVAWLDQNEELEGPVRILLTMERDHQGGNLRKYGVFFRVLST